MHIAKASLEDIPKMLSLINNAYRGEESRKGWTTEADLLDGMRTNAATLREMMQRENAVFLKYNNEENSLEGCVYLEKRNSKMYLGMLSVWPELQLKGIGKKLLSAAEQFARDQKCSVIEMNVISVRSELIEWYLRHGYSKTGETKPFPSGTTDIPKQPLEFIILNKSL